MATFASRAPLRMQVDTREIQRGLREFNRDLEKRTRKKMRDLARTVRDDARRPMPRGPTKGGHATSAIRSGADGIIPYVSRHQDDRWSYVPWLDHGGRRPRDTEARPFIREGRYFFPAVRRARRRVIRDMDTVIDQAVATARLG
jgi:hypothetical protein